MLARGRGTTARSRVKRPNSLAMAGGLAALVGLVAPWAFIDVETQAGLEGLELGLFHMYDFVQRISDAVGPASIHAAYLVFVIIALVLVGGVMSFVHPGWGALPAAGALLFALVAEDPRSFGASAAFVAHSYGFWIAGLGGGVAFLGLALREESAAAPRVAETVRPSPNPAAQVDPAPAPHDPPDGAAPGSPAGLPEPWVSRVETTLRELQRSFREQQDFLFDLDRGLLDGRVDNATYHEIRVARQERIGEIREDVETLRRQLSATKSSGPGDLATAG